MRLVTKNTILNFFLHCSVINFQKKYSIDGTVFKCAIKNQTMKYDIFLKAMEAALKISAQLE